jgi:hypothetical protein
MINPAERIAETVEIGSRPCPTGALPRTHAVDAELGLVVPRSMNGRVLYSSYLCEHGSVFETRAVKTPGGDFLLMFPAARPEADEGPLKTWDGHYLAKSWKINDMLAMRSSDGGETWSAPSVAFDIDYNQHGFIPLIPRGTRRIYAFGTQPVWGAWDPKHPGTNENAPIGYRWSDDDGRTWSEVRLIRPRNDPGFLGMSVMQMAETASGAWILGTHEGDHSYKPTAIAQYILRSDDRGQTWDLVPGERHGGWGWLQGLCESRPISVGGNELYMQGRTNVGHLWHTRSVDDGKTWAEWTPSPLVHPHAPPMLFHLGDGETLAAFHHNRGLNYRQEPFVEQMKDRSELWVSFSTDKGRTWSEPRFLLVNAFAPKECSAWLDNQCSYIDVHVDKGVCHIFMPHRWRRVLHLRISESDLRSLPTRAELG